MKFAQFNVEDIWSFLEDVAFEYPKRPYLSSLMERIATLSSEEDFEPYIELTNLKKADPIYQRDMQKFRSFMYMRF